MVYVLSKRGNPLMSTNRHGAVRRWMRDKKAIVVRSCPFTIKLLVSSEEKIQEVKGAIVPNSSYIGIAVSSNGKCLFSSETELRKDISKKMKKRAKYRRSRRVRKVRYRECRFLNRKSDRRFTPTLKSKLDSHQREIKRVEKLLPICNWTVVRNSIKKDYKGYKDLEWLNIQRQVFERDNFKCRHCKGKTRDFELHGHHLIRKEDNGSNELDNLVTLCKKCHVKYHKGMLELKISEHKYRGKLDVELSIIRKYLEVSNSTNAYGFIMKKQRQNLRLSPTPINNACSVLNINPNNQFYIRNISKGDYQQTKGIRSQQRIPTGKIMNVRKFDKVMWKNTTCFIKGRMSTGYAVGMDILNNSLKQLLKLKEVKVLQRRTNSLITEMIDENICYSVS